MPAFLAAIGTATPRHKFSQAAIEAFMAEQKGLSAGGRRLLRAVYQHSGIAARHSVLPDFDGSSTTLFGSNGQSLEPNVDARMATYAREAPALAVAASAEAFAQRRSLPPATVSHLITFSCTGMAAPGLDIALVRELGLPTHTARTCINFMGCYAGITALRTAAEIVRGNPAAVVLLAGVELCTLHFLAGNSRDQLVANALFADGAAAALVTGQNDGTGQLELTDFRTELAFDDGAHMAWQIREAAFEIKLSSYVPSLIEGGLQALVQALAGGNSFAGYAIHPGGKGILEATEAALGLTSDDLAASYHVLEHYGNMSSVTLFFVLRRLIETTAFRHGDRVLACAFGPGLTLESAALRVV